MALIQKYFSVYLIQIKNNFVREAVYRTNFLTSMVVDVIWIFVEFSFFSIIYANTSQIAGWNKDQVFFFLGVFFASDALFSTFLQRNFWNFSDLVNKGELDILLTKPIHPLFLALSRWINLTSIFNVFFGIAIMLRYSDGAGFTGGWKWFLVLFWLVIGMITQTLVRFAFSVWIFWTERSFALARLYFQFFAFATKPDVIYPKLIRYMLLTFLPFAFISSIPTRALLFGLKPMEYALVGVVFLAFFILDSVLWKKGLKRYQSSSS